MRSLYSLVLAGALGLAGCASTTDAQLARAQSERDEARARELAERSRALASEARRDAQLEELLAEARQRNASSGAGEADAWARTFLTRFRDVWRVVVQNRADIRTERRDREQSDQRLSAAMQFGFALSQKLDSLREIEQNYSRRLDNRIEDRQGELLDWYSDEIRGLSSTADLTSRTEMYQRGIVHNAGERERVRGRIELARQNLGQTYVAALLGGDAQIAAYELLEQHELERLRGEIRNAGVDHENIPSEGDTTLPADHAYARDRDYLRRGRAALTSREGVLARARARSEELERHVREHHTYLLPGIRVPALTPERPPEPERPTGPYVPSGMSGPERGRLADIRRRISEAERLGFEADDPYVGGLRSQEEALLRPYRQK